MAGLLGELLPAVEGIRLSRLMEARCVFAIMPEEMISKLQQEYFFHICNESKNEVRLMRSFDTTEEDFRELVESAKRLMR